MPITAEDGTIYDLIGLTVDIYTSTFNGILRIDPPEADPLPEGLTMQIRGADFDGMFDATPTPGLTRGQDIINAIYQHCLDSGIVSGTIS